MRIAHRSAGREGRQTDTHREAIDVRSGRERSFGPRRKTPPAPGPAGLTVSARGSLPQADAFEQTVDISVLTRSSHSMTCVSRTQVHRISRSSTFASVFLQVAKRRALPHPLPDR